MKRTDPVVLKNAYASIFKGEMGKIVMKDLKDFCHVDMPVLVPGQADTTAFNDGKRFVFLRICKMAKLDLDRIMAQSDNQGR